MPSTEALAVARSYLGRTNVECVGTDEADVVAAFAFLEERKLGRLRVADALLAATLLVNGVTEIVNCNPGDFDGFDDLTLVDPVTS